MNYYQRNAPRLMAEYQAIDPDQLHAAWADQLPAQPGRALDVGAGSGRDAYWLARKGWEVVAVEPCGVMRRLAAKDDPRVTWTNGSLPTLATVTPGPYDLILVSAVWMHLSPDQQPLALKRLEELLAPDGLLVLSWRTVGADQDRGFFPVQESLFQDAFVYGSEDQQGRIGVGWKTAVMRKTKS